MTLHALQSPVDGSVYAQVEVATDELAGAVVKASREAQASWAGLTLSDRIKYIRAFLSALVSQTDRVAEELTWQMGRPIAFTPKEVARVVERSEAMIVFAERGLAPVEPPAVDGAVRQIRRVPHGVCLVVAPWNYPYLTAINTIIPALIAGNSVILKPSLQTALTGERLADAFRSAGLPSGVFASVMVTHETVSRWIGNRDVDFVAFTGSVRGGREIENAAAGRFLPVSLELGGKDPAYVRLDADIDDTVNELVDGSFFNSGQSCCGIERIYVHQDIYSDFCRQFVKVTLETQVLGDPRDSKTTLGPVVSARAAQEIRRQIASAVALGATVATGDNGSTSDSLYIPATVLLDVNHDMEVMTEETFGPVVGIMPVADDEEALRLMNDSRYGLSASIWTRDQGTALKLGERVATGTLFVNRCDYLDPGLAWTGIKDTGRGCSLSELSYAQVTRPMSFYARQGS